MVFFSDHLFNNQVIAVCIQEAFDSHECTVWDDTIT